MDEKELVINNFKSLYQHSNNKIFNPNKILNLLINQLDIIINDDNAKNLPPPMKPKSRAKDKYGFSQQEIINIVKSENLYLTAVKMKYILEQIKNLPTNNIIIHNISKQLLRKKKDIIESANDLRGIAIMPAIIMAVDKITIQYSSPKGNTLLSQYQHGASTKLSTNTAKLNYIYITQKQGFNFCALLDLSKAFDKVDRILQKDIIKNLDDIHLSQLLLQIIEVYDEIKIEVQDETINPTRGLPQGSTYGPLLFTLYINNLLNEMNGNTDKIKVQAFVDDLIIFAKDLNSLQEAFNHAHNLIKGLNMELNMNKCILLSNSENDSIKDEFTGTIINATQTTKYLGQTIDNKGETTNIINTYDYGSISSLIKNTINHVTLKAKIKLFLTYVKANFMHLIPMIALTGNIEQTWKNIRKAIFNDILERKTLPRETGSILGISFYSIIIKPILKLLANPQILNDKQMSLFFKESIKKIFKAWLNVEPNNTIKIKEYIEDLLSKDIMHSLEEFQQEIYDQAAIRLFRNKNLPPNVIKLTRAKLPRLLDIISNAPEHLIFETLKQKALNQKHPDKEGIEKIISEPIKDYIAVYKFLKYETPKLDKPDQENLKEILEYEQIYDLKIDIILDKEIKDIQQRAENLITKAIEVNKNSLQKDPIIPQELNQLLNDVRINITKENKDKWMMLEIILEKINHIHKLSAVKPKKKQPGRPKIKLNHIIEKSQTKIDNFFN